MMMRKHFVIALTGLIIMGLFGFTSIRNSDIRAPILGMILLDDANSVQMEKVVAELKGKWKLFVDDKESDTETSVLVIDNYRIAVVNMAMPIPGDEIKTTAEYNYYWQDGISEATKHKGHVILSLLNAGKNPVKENMLFNKVAAAIMNNSNALGIYIADRTLLLKKEFYLANTRRMSDENIPLHNWIYFGLRQENGKQSVYTFGMADFNKPEMEIINSSHSLDDLNEMMYNIVHYVIASDVTFRHGETLGLSASQMLEISYSKGIYLKGKTLKIKY